MKILADAHIPYLRGVAEQFGEVEYLPGNLFTKKSIKDKDVLIVRTVTRFDEEILSGSRVKLICSATIGFDHIDTDYCNAQGIAWHTAPGCNASSVEQYVTASLLHLAKKHRFRLNKMTIGIVGVGNVGGKVATACEMIGMRVLLNDPPREEKEGSVVFTDIDTIKREADIISIHTPLIKTGKHKTYHLIDDDFLHDVACRPFIVNAARGAVTDNHALVNALRDKRISGVVMDCWENEPHIDCELLGLADIATPHIAGYSADGKWNAAKMSLENINNYFKLGLNPTYKPIPRPTEPVIDLEGVDRELQFSHAVWHTYNPIPETDALKMRPYEFYNFRSKYPIRREYPAYMILKADRSLTTLLKNFGFQ